MPATKDLCSGYRYYAIAQIDRAVREYLDAHGLSQNGPEREIYLNDPSEVAAEDLVTEIQYPVRD